MHFVIKGHPIARKRPRISQHGKFSRMYDEQSNEMKKFSHEIEKLSSQQPSIRDAGQYSVDLRFFFEPHGRDINEKLWEFTCCTLKKDLDNLEKLVLDCCTDIIWDDDAQVVELQSYKGWSNEPRTEVTIMPYETMKLSPKTQDILCVFSPEELKVFCDEIKTLALVAHVDENSNEIFLGNAASALGHFTLKYHDKFRKIKKIVES
jgi:Holliday junction resolvase RusA-like endonuclease